MAGQVNKSVNEADIDALLNKKLEEILGKAKEEAAQIINAAKAEADRMSGKISSAEEDGIMKLVAKMNEEAEELVDVYIPKFNKDDNYRFISVNGQNVQVMKGKHVKIPKKFAEVYWRSEDQKASNMDMIADLADEFEQKRDKYI